MLLVVIDGGQSIVGVDLERLEEEVGADSQLRIELHVGAIIELESGCLQEFRVKQPRRIVEVKFEEIVLLDKIGDFSVAATIASSTLNQCQLKVAEDVGAVGSLQFKELLAGWT